MSVSRTFMVGVLIAVGGCSFSLFEPSQPTERPYEVPRDGSVEVPARPPSYDNVASCRVACERENAVCQDTRAARRDQQHPFFGAGGQCLNRLERCLRQCGGGIGG